MRISRTQWALDPDAAATGNVESGLMASVKTHTFPVDVRWLEGKLTLASVPGKEPLHVATPPVFQGGIEGVWSPEDLLVTATASCYAVTLVTIAERREIPIYDLRVSGTGHVSKRDDGRFGFVAIELDAEIETAPGYLRSAEAAAHLAERGCLVGRALDVPVHVGVVVRPSEPVAA